jgi:hypothetical protein
MIFITVISCTKKRKSHASNLFRYIWLLWLITIHCLAGGLCFAYNCDLYFRNYFPDYDLGWWLFAVTIVIGSIGVVFGGVVSDKFVGKMGVSSRVAVLAISQVSTHFSFISSWSGPVCLAPQCWKKIWTDVYQIQINTAMLFFFSTHTYRAAAASWYYQRFFIHQLMHKWIVLKTILKFTLKFTLKQLRHVSVQSHRHHGAHYSCLLKLQLLKQPIM